MKYQLAEYLAERDARPWVTLSTTVREMYVGEAERFLETVVVGVDAGGRDNRIVFSRKTPRGWRPIHTAPKTGELIWIRNDWSAVQPWTDKGRWTNRGITYPSGEETTVEPGWRTEDGTTGFIDGPHLSWRPIRGGWLALIYETCRRGRSSASRDVGEG